MASKAGDLTVDSIRIALIELAPDLARPWPSDERMREALRDAAVAWLQRQRAQPEEP